jgi:predicted transporter
MALGIVVGAPTALAPHAAKAATRGLSTSFTAGIANPILSLAEDVVAAVIAALAILVPTLTALLLIAAVLFAWRWWARRTVRKQTPRATVDPR